ncbi:MAG TPA: acyltransferase family protein [Ideonella sp.]|nr:acyltransferase family protein [Ideonella sp.]
MPAPAHTSPNAATRRYDLDWVRILAFALLIVYHVGMYYVSWDWHVKSPASAAVAPLIEPLMILTAPWRLALLFFVAGVASAFLLARRPAGFLGARSKRLLLPLLFGMAVIVPPQAYFEVVEKLGYADSYLAFWGRYLAADGSFCQAADCLRLPTWNHLWFVAYLWVYTLLLWAACRWAPRAVEAARRTVARALSGVGLLLWPVLVLALARLSLVGRFPSTHALVDDFYNHAQFLPLFALGFLLAQQTAVWEALRRQRWVALALAVASYAFIVWYFGHYDSRPVPDAVRAFQRVVFALDQWAAIAAVLGFARQAAPGDSAARRYLSEAVFPFYILHQTATVLLAVSLRPLALAPALEAPLLIAGTFAACLLGFEAVRRVGWLRPWFGLAPQAPRVRQVALA